MIPWEEESNKKETPDNFMQDLRTRLVKTTAFSVSHLANESNSQSGTELASPIPRHNVSMSHVFKNHNYRVKRSPWFEYHNSTHYLSRNYTHSQLIEAPTVET